MNRDAAIWVMVRQQYGAIARRQLLQRGLRPGAVLSHGSAAALWGFGTEQGALIDVSVPSGRRSRRPGIRVHRRTEAVLNDITAKEGIPVTSPTQTLIDQATRLGPIQLERAVNEADKLDCVKADVLRSSLDDHCGQPGVAPLRGLLDPLTFRLSDSELERLTRHLALATGLPVPETKAWVNGYEVDFFWPELGIVLEADGLRYHRTPSQQKRGLERDSRAARSRTRGGGRLNPLPPHPWAN
jgi:AbiEi antitoxin C-terminal domain